MKAKTASPATTGEKVELSKSQIRRHEKKVARGAQGGQVPVPSTSTTAHEGFNEAKNVN